MGKLVKDGKKDIRIREQVLDLVRFLPSKNFIAEAQAIFHFVRDQIRYVGDIYGVETLAEPWKTLELGQGDCDDKVVLAGAMLQSINHPIRFIAAGFNGQPISHVFLETLIGNQWVPMELTECLPFGQPPKGITDHFIYHVNLRG